MTTYNVTVIDNSGVSVQFTGAEGSKVNNQVLHGMDIHAMGTSKGITEATEVIIPFHAISKAQITATVTEDPEVEDAVCNET